MGNCRLQPRKNGKFLPMKPKLLAKKKSAELAEIIGIMLGDGNCQVIKEKSIYQIRIIGHRGNDFDYLTNYTSGLFKKVFGTEFSIKFPKTGNAVVIFKQSKNLVHTLMHFGIKNGNKTTNGAAIPCWVLGKSGYLKACVRGLIDTDGSVYPKTRRHKTPTIWFATASPTIQSSITKAFKILGYRVSKWTQKKDRNTMQCSMGDSKEVLRYFTEIGFSNKKHINRFKKFCSAPVV
ncbi:MAG: LAGLIDADG family homing endonuclease [Candidatus Diapherotrites archaeon]|nr:LAGLIDADG family homing endonuclease [Candidatus Diapherotrites archaeon]